MKNVSVQFRRRYLILRPRRSQKHEYHRYPVYPYKIKILQNPFLAHRYTPKGTHPQNFMFLTLIVSAGRLWVSSQDILFYIYNTPVLTICAPWNLNFEKFRNYFLGICMKNVLVQFRRLYLILRPRKCQKHKCQRYPVLTL